MGTLRVRNCTIWDVHYWRKGAGNDAVAAPGCEGTIDFGATYTLGVKRINVSPDGKHYDKAVNNNGIYYVVWDSAKQELDILSEDKARGYPYSNDNKHLTNWFVRYNSWMTNLNGSLTLDRFSIPGTHDTGTKDTGKGAAHTQNFDVAAQLQDGIRFLDIRLDGVTEFDTNLVVKHWCILCFLSFDTVLDNCKSFLANNSGETIIMLANTSGCLYSDIESRFQAYLTNDKYKNLFYLGDEIPTLDQARGKVVLLRRFKIKGSETMGIDLSGKDNAGDPLWKKDATFLLTTPRGNKFIIEDNYAEHDTHEKVKVVQDNLNNAIADPNDGIMYITFNSISATLHTPYQYAWGGMWVDPALNPSLQTYLNGKTGNRRFGTVMLDFYNDEGNYTGLLDAIIRSNDGLLK